MVNEVFKRVGASGPPGVPVSASLALAGSELEWEACGAEGFSIKPLFEDPSLGVRTWLMKVDPGAFSPPHAHEEVEQVYVLEGSFYDQEKTYGAGDFVVRAPGAMHSAGSETGAVVILFYFPGVT